MSFSALPSESVRYLFFLFSLSLSLYLSLSLSVFPPLLLRSVGCFVVFGGRHCMERFERFQFSVPLGKGLFFGASVEN